MDKTKGKGGVEKSRGKISTSSSLWIYTRWKCYKISFIHTVHYVRGPSGVSRPRVHKQWRLQSVRPASAVSIYRYMTFHNQVGCKIRLNVQLFFITVKVFTFDSLCRGFNIVSWLKILIVKIIMTCVQDSNFYFYFYEPFFFLTWSI